LWRAGCLVEPSGVNLWCGPAVVWMSRPASFCEVSMVEPVHVALSIAGVLLVLNVKQWVEHRRFKQQVAESIDSVLVAVFESMPATRG
jgi:hypothetical protein